MSAAAVILSADGFSLAAPGCHPVLVKLDEIVRVTAYKRDELATDLICFDVESDGTYVTVHEEMNGFPAWISRMAELPGFDESWYSKVATPPFAPSTTVVFER